jgi:hypothetical protein
MESEVAFERLNELDYLHRVELYDCVFVAGIQTRNRYDTFRNAQVAIVIVQRIRSSGVSEEPLELPRSFKGANYVVAVSILRETSDARKVTEPLSRFPIGPTTLVVDEPILRRAIMFHQY